MASPSLALPGAVFVGEDERSRIVVHLGPAAGWMIPKGIVGWSTELSVVARDALTEEVRREAKIVMPDEQVPPARMPLTHQALRSAPLIAVSGKLVPKLVERGVRVHTVGADRVTSSFYYIGEGGGEETVRIEGDLVAAVGAMLGESADNAAIERVLDGLIDRLLRLLSRDRVNELAVELAAALPRAAADGSGMQDVDLESFEKDLSRLVGASEKYSSPLREIGDKVGASSDRRLDIPLFGEARKISLSPFELMVGERKVSLPAFERWIASGPFSNAAFKAQVAASTTSSPAAAAPAPSPRPAAAAPAPSPRPAAAVAAPAPSPRPAAAAPSPKPASVKTKAAEPKAAETKAAEPKAAEPVRPPPAPISSPAVSQQSPPSSMKPLSAPLTPPRPASNPPPRMRAESRPAVDEVKPPPPAAVPSIVAEVKSVEPEPPPAKVEETIAEAPKSEPKPEPVIAQAAPPPEPEKIAEPVVDEPVAPTKESAKVQAVAKVDPEPSQDEESSAEPKPVAKATRKVVDDEDRDATTRKIQRPEKSKSFTWILLVVAIAAIFAGYRLFVAN